MRITECSIENFGRLRAEKYSFNKGINSITADNGSGKTTLAAFITAMFYGLSDTKKTSLDENERKKYMPWGGGIFGGSLNFEKNGKTYRIERSFGKKPSEDTFYLYDAASGRICNEYSENLGEELFGIDADGFLRTVFLSEKTLSEKNANKSISAKLSGTTGIDADTGELDNALAILEGQRKLYAKRGGAGIISDTRSRAEEIYSEITRLRAKESGIPGIEGEIARLEAEISKTREEKDSYEKARGELENERRVKTYKEQYENMRRGIAVEEEKYKKLAEFFENGKPSFEEIDTYRMKELEFERTMSENESFSEMEELRGLERLYGKESPSETERIYALAVKAESTRDEPLVDVPMEFASRVPSEAEIDFEISRLKKGRVKPVRRILSASALVLGIGLSVSAFFTEIKSLPFAVLLSAGALFLLGSLILFLTSGGKSRREMAEKRARDFIFSVSNEAVNSDLLDTLYGFKEKLRAYSAGLNFENTSLKRRREGEEARREIYDFLAKFPAPSAKTLTGAVLEIREKQRRIEALTLMSERLTENMSEKKRTAMRGMEEVSLFLSRFKTVTDRPFDEIRDKLSEFSAVSLALDAKRRGIDDFARMNGLDNKPWNESLLTEAQIEGGRKAAEDRIFDLSKEKIILERRLEADRLEIEKIGSLISEKAVLDSEERRFEKNLDIIKKTQKYLTEAHEKMTARYLDKTVSGFKKYVKEIGFDSGDFVIDTDFTLTKYEGAAARRTESFSKGTRELYALALRLALTDSLFEGDAPFVIFDDPFMSLDDKTLERAKAAVREISKTKQVIYFTCSKTRAL